MGTRIRIVAIALAVATPLAVSALAVSAGTASADQKSSPGQQKSAAQQATTARGMSYGRPETGRAVTSGNRPGRSEHACTEAMHHVVHQGSSCRIATGLFKVQLADGSFTYTHGPDPVGHTDHDDDAPAVNGFTGNLGTVSARNPVCASANPHGNFGIRAIIALPSDGSQTITVAAFRSMLTQIDGAIYKSAVESGAANGADLVFDCDSTGAIQVDVQRLAHTTAASSFATITGDLRNLGYTSTGRNYAVFFTATMSGAGGQGSLNADSSNSAANTNNTGGRFAIDYGINAAETMMHEIGHNLGAVQPGAPYATGSSTATSAGNWGHCWEGQDVMCYNDGGSSDPGYISWVCSDFDHFDCGHDDYFDAVIGAGQGGSSTGWLANHFNIAACYDVFVVNHACTTTTSGDTTPPAVSQPTQTVQYLGQISNGLVPVTYSWSATDASGVAQYDAWISTNGTWYQLTLGTTTATSGTWQLTPGSSYQMATRAKDGAGNWSGYAYGPTFVVDAYQENAAAVSYGGTWQSYAGSYFGGKQNSSGTTSSWAKVTFTGRGFAWYAATASNRGVANVWVDGTYAGTVDSYSASTNIARGVLTRNWSTSGAHTVQVQVVGTAGRPTIDVDAFVALR
jgi:hypothetical protein